MKKLLLFCSLLTATFTPLIAQNVGTKLIREDRIWLYRGYVHGSPQFGYEYQMRFEGTTEINGILYHNLKTENGKGYIYNGPGSEVETVEIPDCISFLIREENGKIYRHAPIGDEAMNNLVIWQNGESEGLLYDFNAETGEYIDIVESQGNIITGYISSTNTVQINGEDCKQYTMQLREAIDYTVIEGIGNISRGCLPYFDTDMIAGSLFPYILPKPCTGQMLSKVYDLNKNVIYENEEGIEWPWEINSVEPTNLDSRTYYSNGSVVAEGMGIAVYDMAGKRVAQGHGSLSTASLQPGVYIVKAGASTLKITVK